MSARVGTIDWERVGRYLDEAGNAALPALLSPEECDATAALYPENEPFRATIVMARHGFGRGEYKYFRYPLPDPLASLRTALYPRLAPIANRWNEAMGLEGRYPETHAAFLERCHAAGQRRPTPLLLLRRGRLQLPAPGRLRRARLPAAGGDPALRAGPRLQRRRVRDDGAAAADAVAGRGGTAAPG